MNSLLKYGHLMAIWAVFWFFTISLGRPETFEKVAKMGVGMHIWPWEVT